ncbi:hypothetical protein TVAG_413060 [Trichomonas vaginalis G3]|uniref:Uncharacterized protein n=1 Tax=Trichomonas vaginalis (strain ATCC PRA-98 / G3) TaxID=412133 RepID=A2F6J0_TRIV3|nr:glycoprotein 38 family [Trichomonas vaginalis G3]EAX99488.1 hypothetical protein TVAG_413060 [Trichomonas vaginalis G3]KAI5538687.1 glycoprotein 38 family [Trichomonas vaginalis G3]|eukprot:XP_001312418.1 hypothetical protein [Trichomonas vaginalis G3]
MLLLFLVHEIKSYDLQNIADCYQNDFISTNNSDYYFLEIPAGEIFCSNQSFVIAANTSIQADYFLDNGEENPTIKHLDDPFAIIQSENGHNIISKISAKDPSETFLIQIIKITRSNINERELFYSVFSTNLFFCQKFIPLRLTDSNSTLLLRRWMEIKAFNGYEIKPKMGNFSSETAILTTTLSCNDTTKRRSIYFAYYSENHTLAPILFKKDKFYLMPSESGVYSRAEVESFTEMNPPFHNEYKFDQYDLTDEFLPCLNNIWSPEFAHHDIGLKYTDSKVFTIQPGKAQCLYGNFVFGSKEDFTATVVYNDTKHYELNNRPKVPRTVHETYENPFSITTQIHDQRQSQLIKLQCKSQTESCKIQVVSVMPPIQNRLLNAPMKIESTFTTNTSYFAEKEIIIEDTRIEIFSITVHNKNKFGIKISCDDKRIQNYLTTSNSFVKNFTSNESIYNTVTIYPYFDLHRFLNQEENISTFKVKTNVKVEIIPSEENSTGEKKL